MNQKWLWIIGGLVIVVLGGVGIYLRTAKKPNPAANRSTSSTITTATPASLSKFSWTMFRGDAAHAGYAAVSGPTAANVKWKYLINNKEGEWPNSVILSSNGTVYVASGKGLHAFDKNGKLLWEKSYPKAQGPALSADETTLYFGANTDIIAASSTDGTEKWRFKTGKEVHFGPTIGSDGVLYQGSWDKYFYALKPDGALKWKYETAGAVSYPPSIGSDGTIYLGGGDAHAGSDGNVYAFNTDGSLKWKYDTKMNRVGTPAILADGTILAPASPTLFALKTDGSLLWKKGPNVGGTSWLFPKAYAEDLGPPPGQSQKTDVTNSGSGGAQSPSTQNQSSSSSSTNQTQSQGAQGSKGDITGIITPAISPSGLIYSGTSEGIVLGLDLATQEKKWEFKTGTSPKESSKYGMPAFPIVDKNGVVFFGSIDGKMYAIDKDGKEVWSYKTGGPITEAAPAMGSDGTLYFTAEDGYLYAIGS